MPIPFSFHVRSSLAPALFLAIALLPPPFLTAQTDPGVARLTEAQIEAIRQQIETLRTSQYTQSMTRNGTAEQVFRAAASSPKAAVELYLKCYQELNFTRLNKDAGDWRDWLSANEEQMEFEPFVGALQLQLEYLSLATRASQSEDISKIFGDLTAFMRKLGSLSTPPHPYLDSDISASIFAEVYELQEALRRRSQTWELNPINISGVYEKTILPHLRTETPANLDKAWQARIDQQTLMARLFLAFEDQMERYQKDFEGGPRWTQGEVTRMANFVRNQARQAERFEAETLPRLQWERLKDQFAFGNQPFAAKAMLDLIANNLGHPNAPDWIAGLEELVSSGGALPPSTPAN